MESVHDLQGLHIKNNHRELNNLVRLYLFALITRRFEVKNKDIVKFDWLMNEIDVNAID